MISSYVFIGISFSIFWGIYLLRKKKEGIPCYSKGEILLFYLVSRILPVTILPDMQKAIWRNIFLEWFILALLYYYVHNKKTEKVQSSILVFYLFQPGSILAILTGNERLIFLILPVMMVICLLDEYVKRKKGSLFAFLPEYLIGNVAIFCWFAAVDLLGQSLKEIWNTENIPILYILSLLLGFIAFWKSCYRIGSLKFFLENREDGEKTDEPCTCMTGKEKAYTVKDMLFIILFTVVFGTVAFYHLGSSRVPETYETFQVGETGKNEIVLGFDKEVTLSKIYIYLGYTGKRTMSFSYRDSKNKDWVVFDSKHEVTSVFCWNAVEVNHSVDSLGIVLMEGQASIHEIVCLDMNGNRVLPVNASGYPNLFDEQGLFHLYRTFYDQTMFDEVYHARTAYEFLNGLSIYENTHPPLGKTIISLGIRLLGMNPFGWRCMCALLGTLMIPLIYVFAHAMFGRTDAACFTTLLLGTEFMHFTLSRIATLDILVAFFVLLMFYFMYCFIRQCGPKHDFKKQRISLFFCGFSMSLAVATKWTGFYAAAGIAIAFFVFLWKSIGGVKGIMPNRKYLMKLCGCCILFFVAIPGVIYVLSYLPFARVYTDKNLLQLVIENGKLMLSYHSSTVFEHPYSSEWYEWLIDYQPLLDTYSILQDGKISTIATFGNPLIWWGGLAAFFHQFYLWRCKKCKNAQYLMIAYLSVLIPWLFIHRTVFIYQYCLCSLVLILMWGNSLMHIKKQRKYMLVIGACSLLLFVMFYPALSGIPVNAEYVNQVLEWMSTWKFALS